jgi:hypothetical protein
MRRGKPGCGNGNVGNTHPLVSIAMCTYNGEAYLSDQLVSIVKQTQQPDELIVCDDGSTDNTLQILDQFSKEAPFPVRVYRNQQRLGPTKNFEKALSFCSGDFIFLSDQDDVWMPQKVSRLLQALRNNPDAGYVFSDALIVDEGLRPTGYTMWQPIKFTPGQRRKFEQGKQVDVLLKHNVVTGATMALRAELRNISLPIPESWFHDAWIALLGSSTNMYGIFVEKPLIQYRQHSQQVIGGRLRLSFIEQVKEARVIKGQSFESQLFQVQANYGTAMDRLIVTGQLREDIQQRFDAKIQHLQARRSLHKRPHYLPRLIGVSKELLTCRYHRFSGGWKSAAGDLLL